MKKQLRIGLVVLAGVALLGAAGWSISQLRTRQTSSDAAAASAAMAAELEERNREIAFREQRVALDPFSAGDQAALAALFLQRARETGSHDDVLRAEQAARRSLALRQRRNGSTYLLLSTSLVNQHRFGEALTAARELMHDDPENPVYRAHLGEVQMELGQYDSARVTFGSLEPAARRLDVAPRLARWLEITGQTREARTLLREAHAQVMKMEHLPREQRAWFGLRLGDFELRHGDLGRAEKLFREALAISPDDHRLLAAMARLEAARGRWPKVIEYGDEAIATALDPATVGLVSDAYAALGDRDQAEDYFQTMKVAASSDSTPFHRAWSLFLLDHGRDTTGIVARAREDLRTRRDIYGYDLLAWALHRQGRHAEARQPMAAALRLGTPDPILFFHAGMIERALGHGAIAERHLRRALEINPRFHPTQSEQARAVLDSIRRER